MIKQSLITIATLGVLSISAIAADSNATKAESNATKTADVNTAACAGCHGKDFEKKALNVSKIVKDMKKADIVTSLKGYKEGKGGAMKAVMAGQVKALSEADMTAIAEKFGK
jgi:cytochrome c-type protein NapB